MSHPHALPILSLSSFLLAIVSSSCHLLKDGAFKTQPRRNLPQEPNLSPGHQAAHSRAEAPPVNSVPWQRVSPEHGLPAGWGWVLLKFGYQYAHSQARDTDGRIKDKINQNDKFLVFHGAISSVEMAGQTPFPGMVGLGVTGPQGRGNRRDSGTAEVDEESRRPPPAPTTVTSFRSWRVGAPLAHAAPPALPVSASALLALPLAQSLLGLESRLFVVVTSQCCVPKITNGPRGEAAPPGLSCRASEDFFSSQSPGRGKPLAPVPRC